MEITAKTGIYGAAVVVALVLSFLGGNLTDEQIDTLYFCEVENSVKECSSLSSYGVNDARCNFPTPDVNGKTSDICTASGVRQAWKPARDYLNIITPKGAVVIEALQKCHIEYYNVTEDVIGNCYRQQVNYSDCLNEVVNVSSPTGYTCVEWGRYNQSYKCVIGTKIVTKNQTICEQIGFDINYSDGRAYQIKHDCCGYYNESPYEQFTGYQLISCKVKIKDICNPEIQQSSKDPSVYDEPGRIFVITADGIKPYLVGANEYVLNNDIYMGKVEGIK